MQSTSITIPSGATLGGLAASNGVSVSDIMNANKGNTAAIPDPSNPDKIIAGTSLNIPKPAVIQTSTAQRAQTAENTAGFNSLVSNKQGAASPSNPIPTYQDASPEGPADPNASKAGQTVINVGGNPAPAPAAGANGGTGGSAVPKPGDIDPTTGQPTGANGFKYDAQGNKVWVDASGNALADSSDPMTAIKGQIADMQSAGKVQIANMTASLNQALSLSSANTAATIRNLTALYGQRIAATEDSYNRLGASKNEQNIRTGLERYASTQGAGILTDNEVSEQQAITNILTKMNDAITKAQQAQDSNDTKTFNATYKQVQDMQKQLDTSVNNLYKEAVTYQNNQAKALATQQKNAQNDMKTSISTAKSIAPSIAAELSGMTSKQKQDFIKSVATKYNVDPGLLQGYVNDASTKASQAASRAAPKAPAGSKTKPSVSGGLSYTNDDIGQIQAAFTKGATVDGTKYLPQGKDGYVDPGLYEAMASKWTAAGGIVKDFVAKFPPKDYINPVAVNGLPAYLQSGKAGAAADPTLQNLGS